MNDTDPSGKILRSALALLLDVVLTLVVPCFSGPLDLFGRIISAYAKRKNFALVWEKLLYGVVPKFKSVFPMFITGIKRAIWRVTGSFISNSVTTFSGNFVVRFTNFISSNKFKFSLDVISCFFSAGSMVAGLLDWFDGNFDGKVRII